MFKCQRDLVVYIHNALMQPHEETSMARAFKVGLWRYAFDNELTEWIREAMAEVFGDA